MANFGTVAKCLPQADVSGQETGRNRKRVEISGQGWQAWLTLLTASRKSFSVTVFRRALIANMPASVHTLRMSAPVLLGHRRASSSNLMSRSQFMVLVCMLKIWALDSRSGSPNSTCTKDRDCLRHTISQLIHH